MARPSVRFTRSAREDLINIWMDGAQIWGEDQADRYQKSLMDACERLAQGTAPARPVSGLSGITHYRNQSHHIFMLENTEPLIVLAVLHERMDLMERLKDRLGS